MDTAIFYDTLQQGLWISFKLALPILSVALVAGLTVGLFQALTSIQEMTLTFVPKLAAIVVVFWSTMAYMTETLVTFFQSILVPMIVAGG